MVLIPKTIFTGGGSGGHLSIMKALIEYMREGDYDIDDNLLIVGGKLGMISDSAQSLDERLIPTFGVPYQFIRGGKLHRAFKFTTFKLLWGFFPGLLDSYKVIKKFNPEIIFATGGYVSLPMIIVGKLLGKKVIIHEQTLTAGLTNSWGAKFANKVLLTFEESAKYFPKKKTVVTGNAIRKDVFSNKCEIQELIEKVKCAKLENRKIIYITGGSLGAHKINQFFIDNLDRILEKYTLIWQTGENEYHGDFKKIEKEELKTKNSDRLYFTKFVKSEIGYILGNADLVVCRPGANTLYELAATKNRALMIPLWVTSKTDQENNAKWFEQNYVGEILKEKYLSVDSFNKVVDSLILKEPISPKFEIDGIEEGIVKEIFED